MLAGKVAQISATAALKLLLAQSLDLLTFGLRVTVISGQLLLSRVLLLGVEVGIIRLHHCRRSSINTRNPWLLMVTVNRS